MIRKKFLSSLFLGIMVCSASLFSTAKKADDVFKKWLEWQKVFEPIDISEVKDNLAQVSSDAFRRNYELNLSFLRKNNIPFLETFTNEQVNKHGHIFKRALDDQFKENLERFYEHTEKDIRALTGFLEPLLVNKQTLKERDDNLVIEDNKALGLFLFAQDDMEKQEALLFSVANTYFRTCFSEENFPIFEKMLLDKALYPVLRFYYATIWFNLAGGGWKHWSAQSLRTLQEEAEDGKTIVYIAGGSDIYQLVKAGIYNVKIIDPQLPSQIKYYTDDWEWIVKGDSPNGGIGDQIIFDLDDDKKIILHRAYYKESDNAFKARLSNGEVIVLNKSKTIWAVLDQEGNQLGTYTFDRRFTKQEDFVAKPNEVLLTSFNELFFIAQPDFLNGWQIEPTKFELDLKIHVKQLHEPVSRHEVCNIRVASLLNNSDFKFIWLGTCIN